MMWSSNAEKFKSLYGGLLKQYIQCYNYPPNRKKRLQQSILSSIGDGVGTEETDSETEEKIRSASLIEKFPNEIFRTTQLIFSFEAGKIVSRLREPHQLYAMARSMGKQNKALWPNELQVKIECIEHKQLPPAQPEPFYQQTGDEDMPMVRDNFHDSQVVYEYDANTSSYYFSSRRANKARSIPCVNLNSIGEDTLHFESRFESGNLAKAVQVGKYDYELYVHCDLYTQKHTQWYYFQVSNTRKGIPYRFTIVNFFKNDSLYNHGMKPLLYSEKAASDPKQPTGWQRIGDQIKYYKNNLKCEGKDNEQVFFSLTWLFEFSYDKDTTYFAHCYPYTYTDLQTYLMTFNNNLFQSKIYTQRILCKTIAGNNVYILTITNPCKNPEESKLKKVVVLTARVHPGESNASWMMKGFLDYITSNSLYADILRDNFVFKVVPMLNPDGVIVGNYRCSLSGRDLNRNYKTILKDSFPSVWNIRNMVKKLLTKREVLIYCDLHGHSRKQNMFMYGCENLSIRNQNKFFQERIFPLLLSKHVPDIFKFESCKFKIQKSREGTGRVIMWNMGIINSFTLEASFCGSTLGNKKGTHFSTEDYELMGHRFCSVLLEYCDPDPNKFISLTNELKEYTRTRILNRWQQKGMCIDNVTITKDDMLISESSDAGSDSSDSEESTEYLPQNLKKKKKLKNKRQHYKKIKLHSLRSHSHQLVSKRSGSETKDEEIKLPVKKTQKKRKKKKQHRHKKDNNETECKLPKPTEEKKSTKTLKGHLEENDKKLAMNLKLTETKQLPSSHHFPGIHYHGKYIRYDKNQQNGRPIPGQHLRGIHSDEKLIRCVSDLQNARHDDLQEYNSSDEYLRLRLNKGYNMFCGDQTETLLENYLSNLGVRKEKNKVPQSPSHFNIKQDAIRFIENLSESSSCFTKPKKNIQLFSRHTKSAKYRQKTDYSWLSSEHKTNRWVWDIMGTSEKFSKENGHNI